MNYTQAEVLAEEQFGDWASNLPESLRAAAGSSFPSIGNYTDNKFNRSVLSSDQLQMLIRAGVNLDAPPTNKGVRGVLQFSRRIMKEPATKGSDNHPLDDAPLFIEGRDPNENLIYVALIYTVSGDIAANFRAEVLKSSCADS